MKTFKSAYRAAKAVAKERDERDEFDEACNDYTDRLLANGVIEHKFARHSGRSKWLVDEEELGIENTRSGNRWFAIDPTGTKHGPYKRKKDALGRNDLERGGGACKRLAPGVYRHRETAWEIVREDKFADYEKETES